MKDTKHTPGPWKLVVATNHPTNANEQIAFIQSSKQTCFDFSCVESEINRKEFEANAKLIAAAPELLEALEYADYFFNGGVTTPRHRLEIKEMIKKAIQKAKGL